MDSEGTPASERSVLAVFETEDEARRARDRLVAGGVAEDAITIGGDGDEVASLRAEMHEEVSKAWIMPQASFIATKEGARGFVVTLVVIGAIALVLGIPLAFIDFGFDFWIRLLVVEAIMLCVAFAIALVFGPGLASIRPDVPMAAERGITVRVDADTPAVRQAIVDLAPIRVDEIGPRDVPVDTVFTEDDRGSTSVASEAGRAVRDLTQNAQTDDFHAPPGQPSERRD